MSLRTTFGSSIAALLLLVGVQAQDSKSLVAIPERVVFNRDIRPILSDNCVQCHGPGTRKGNLRLDLRDSAFGPAESGKIALVPGDLEKSELWQRISTTETGDKMPPRKSGKKLTPREVAVIKRWIEQGAQWQGHWAFLPLEKPAAPKTRDGGWARGAVDAYIHAGGKIGVLVEVGV
ncbi:MAG: hypothetical protein EHM91_17005, partial [Planctomycetota bacterium]